MATSRSRLSCLANTTVPMAPAPSFFMTSYPGIDSAAVTAGPAMLEPDLDDGSFSSPIQPRSVSICSAVSTPRPVKTRTNCAARSSLGICLSTSKAASTWSRVANPRSTAARPMSVSTECRAFAPDMVVPRRARSAWSGVLAGLGRESDIVKQFACRAVGLLPGCELYFYFLARRAASNHAPTRRHCPGRSDSPFQRYFGEWVTASPRTACGCWCCIYGDDSGN